MDRTPGAVDDGEGSVVDATPVLGPLAPLGSAVALAGLGRGTVTVAAGAAGEAEGGGEPRAEGPGEWSA